MKTEVRTLYNCRIAALCIDCNAVLAGMLSVQFIETHEGRGLQVFISTGEELHPIGRLKCDGIPVVPFDIAGEVATA